LHALDTALVLTNEVGGDSRDRMSDAACCRPSSGSVGHGAGLRHVAALLDTRQTFASDYSVFEVTRSVLTATVAPRSCNLCLTTPEQPDTC